MKKAAREEKRIRGEKEPWQGKDKKQSEKMDEAWM